MACTKAKNASHFAYCGLTIDYSRYFWTKDFLEKQIDAMAYLKLDRLHWHFTDGGGWRVEVEKYPRLTDETSYCTQFDWAKWWMGSDRKCCHKNTQGAYSGYYTQEDIRDIIRYAAACHIEITPEIEMPGHNDEVVHTYPELSCIGKPHTQSDFCVGKETTYSFMENVLKGIMQLFLSEYIHIGGDGTKRRT